MNTIPQVIVYRNPLEAAMWDSLSNGAGYIFPVICGFVMFFVSFIILMKLTGYTFGTYGKRYNILSYINIAISFVIAGIVIYTMVI